MQKVYSKEPMPDKITKSIFLAGGTYRNDKLKPLSWRFEALDILKKLNYTGTVYIPEDRDGYFDKSRLEEQIQWERTCCKAADIIVFWIPRELRPDYEMLCLTTNVEFGLYLDTHKLFIGSPKEAVMNEYLQFISKHEYKWYDSLGELLKDVVDYLGDGVERTGVECKIPKMIFESKQFQNWYQSQLSSGNYLTDYETLYSFVMPKAKKLFMTMFKPNVYVKDENRVKDIEFVVARSNMSYTLAYYRPNDNLLDTEIVLVKEFRSPVSNKDSFVYELPGGSSIDDSEDELEVASQELKEEIGLEVSPSRIKYITELQSSATLCSHKISLYKVELTKDEIDSLKFDADNKITHGNIEDTEKTYTVIANYNQLLNGDYPLDFTNLGMISVALRN